MDIISQICSELNLNQVNVKAAISLLDEGSTVPFIARYRKEKTGGLTDENLRNIEARLVYLRSLQERKETVFASLKEQNITDPVLLDNIDKALTLAEVEDYYRPYKPKKVTRASKAKKAGLEPLSKYIMEDKTNQLNEEAKKYLCDGYETVEKAISGALDILAEKISDNASYRIFIKNIAFKDGRIETTKEKDSKVLTYDNYASYSRKLSQLKGYNVLAINRGCNEKVLTKKLIYDDDTILNYICDNEIPKNTPYDQLLQDMIVDSYDRLIKPSVDNDVFSSLMDEASDSAISEFKISLKATLLDSPLRNKRILGFDPGFINGCKVACIDENGKLIGEEIIENPFNNSFKYTQAQNKVLNLIKKYKIDVIALGNGTASRESEKMLKEMKSVNKLDSLDIIIVSESGASIWSATENAQKEFPNLSPNLRSAVSLARRLLDPLSELVKIPPESIGVGQYQYDIEKKKLTFALNNVVEDCVNYVGVDLNTASSSLLSHISGINEKLALNIVETREKEGPILSRNALLKISGMGPKAFQNCAGFLRIPESKEELDNTSVHPESYAIAKSILKEINAKDKEERIRLLQEIDDTKIKSLESQLNVGEPTLKDIIKELIKPSRDPRDVNKIAHLNDDITDIKDLKVGMILEGTVRNVTGFGCFVDLGVEINGLVHISQLSDSYVSDPHEVVTPGDIIKVKITELDLTRNRISLTMKKSELGNKKE